MTGGLGSIRGRLGALLQRPDILVPLCVGLLAAAGSLNQLGDWDTFYHLAYGRDLVRRHGFAAEDPFLYSREGLPSTAQPSWLGSLLIYLSWVVGGDTGTILFVGLLGGLLFLILSFDGLEGETSPAGFLVGLLPLTFAFLTFRERAVARPELFSDVLLAWTIVALRRAGLERRWFFWAFPAVAALWVNLHNSVLAGVVVFGIFVIVVGAEHLGARFSLPLRPEAPVGVVMAAAASGVMAVVASSFLNPAGSMPIRISATFVSSVLRGAGVGAGGSDGAEQAMSLLARTVDELKPPGAPYWLGPFGWLVLVAAVSLALSWRRGSVREAANAVAFVLLATGARRFVVLAAIVLAPVAARNLRRARQSWLEARPRRVSLAIQGTFLALIVLALALRFSVPEVRWGFGTSRDVPRRSLEYLKALGPGGRFFNTFHLGGLLEWTLDRKVFQDGRGNLRSEDGTAAAAGPSAYGTFRQLDRRYRFDALFVSYLQFGGDAFREKAAMPGQDWAADRSQWALVAFDDAAQVYLRRDGAFAARAARDEYQLTMPANSLVVERLSPPGALLAELDRSLTEAPGCLRCKTMKGYTLLDLRRDSEAAAAFAEPARDADPEIRLYALLGLARIAERMEDWPLAESRWRTIGRLAPDPSWSRRQLAAVLVREGRLSAAWRTIEKNLRPASENVEDLALGIEIARARGDHSATRDLDGRFDRALRAERAERLLSGGKSALDQGRLPDAIAAFREAALLTPADPRPYGSLGHSLLLAGELSGAGEAARKAIALRPGWGFPHFILARTLEAGGDLREAEREYRAALSLERTAGWTAEAQRRLALLAGKHLSPGVP